MAKRKMTSRRLAVEMARCCAENRCRDVAVLDLRKLSPVTDFFVIATGTSTVQMNAVGKRMRDRAEELGDRPYGAEGGEAGWWTLMDFVDVVVHVFSEPARKYYDLELLWGDAPRVDWEKGWRPPQAPEPPEPA